MIGVDTIIGRGYIDERNLFVYGGSGGGVLTAWIVGHTDRFTAAVSKAPVINWTSFVGTTDGASWYHNFEQLPWDDPTEHLRRSPLMYVGNVTTPTLLMTGERDLRTPMEQTEQFYRGAQAAESAYRHGPAHGRMAQPQLTAHQLHSGAALSQELVRTLHGARRDEGERSRWPGPVGIARGVTGVKSERPRAGGATSASRPNGSAPRWPRGR